MEKYGVISKDITKPEDESIKVADNNLSQLEEHITKRTQDTAKEQIKKLRDE